MDDILVRSLRQSGFNVKYVENITDVGHLSSDGDTGEDKLEKGAKKYGKSVWDVAHEFEDYFWYSMQEIGVQKPDVSCRATDYIEQQLEMVKTLEKKGHTYVIDGDGVYFDVKTFPEYGQMAHLKLNQQEEGARIGEVKGKRNPADFALWKFERTGENRAMSWPSPWAERSFPGWHIECSAMAMHYLGEQLDIHTGGIDHIPVHHTNEIAQAEAATGKKPFVKYWVHHNFLRVEGEKMSKSLGNVLTVDDVKARGFHPRALRLLFLMTHYRSEMNFTWESLEAAQKSWEKLLKQFAQMKTELNSSKNKQVSPPEITQTATYQTFLTHLQNDLATPEALALLWQVAKDKELPVAEKVGLLETFDAIFQIGLTDPKIVAEITQIKTVDLSPEIEKILEQRQQARIDKNWAEADRLRDEIAKLGFTVKDTADGQTIN